MQQAALDAGVELQLVSAFRSIDYQAGMSFDDFNIAWN